jgi:hypothetical protein
MRKKFFHLQENATPFFEWFPYVCPEPVLVKRSFLEINGSKRPFLRSPLCREVGAAAACEADNPVER